MIEMTEIERLTIEVRKVERQLIDYRVKALVKLLKTIQKNRRIKDLEEKMYKTYTHFSVHVRHYASFKEKIEDVLDELEALTEN